MPGAIIMATAAAIVAVAAMVGATLNVIQSMPAYHIMFG